MSNVYEGSRTGEGGNNFQLDTIYPGGKDRRSSIWSILNRADEEETILGTEMSYIKCQLTI